MSVSSYLLSRSEQSSQENPHCLRAARRVRRSSRAGANSEESGPGPQTWQRPRERLQGSVVSPM
jgi:hypothetical protein